MQRDVSSEVRESAVLRGMKTVGRGLARGLKKFGRFSLSPLGSPLLIMGAVVAGACLGDGAWGAACGVAIFPSFVLGFIKGERPGGAAMLGVVLLTGTVALGTATYEGVQEYNFKNKIKEEVINPLLNGEANHAYLDGGMRENYGSGGVERREARGWKICKGTDGVGREIAVLSVEGLFGHDQKNVQLQEYRLGEGGWKLERSGSRVVLNPGDNMDCKYPAEAKLPAGGGGKIKSLNFTAK